MKEEHSIDALLYVCGPPLLYSSLIQSMLFALRLQFVDQVQVWSSFELLVQSLLLVLLRILLFGISLANADQPDALILPSLPFYHPIRPQWSSSGREHGEASSELLV